ncbi:MAG: energy transducer TonB [Bacteroidota bacterium]
MLPSKTPKKASLKSLYTINIQIGLIVTLGILIAAFKVPYQPASEVDLDINEQEVVTMEEIVQTKHEAKTPAPPRPVVPVEVPNSEVFEEEVIIFDSELDMGESLEMPADPPPAPEEQEEEEEEIFMVVEHMPELKGGMAEIAQRIEYPKMARMAGIEGRVIVQFVVNEQGNVVDPQVVRGIGGGCDEEAIRVVKTLEFTPGRQRGMPVKVHYTLPVIFKMQK